MQPRFVADTKDAIEIVLCAAPDLKSVTQDLPKAAQAWVQHHGFVGKAGQSCACPDQTGPPKLVLIGTGEPTDRRRKRFVVGAEIASLPKGTYRVTNLPQGAEGDEILLGFLLSRYRFSRYRTQTASKVELVAPSGADCGRIEKIAQGEILTRDLINTPAEDMGPDALEAAVRDLAKPHDAQVNVISGDDLLKQNLPMIHAVGRASNRTPRLVELTWGNTGPSLCLVGKGVCFDTGGLDLKPAAAMGLMKKDMGGAAATLGLAHMIMSTGLPIRLRVLIPAVENSVAGNAFRPGDILRARNGLSVEINNTDAEGRLVLADALALACETPPDLLVSMATLTGAARVAVGSDLAPFFCDDDDLAKALVEAATEVADPVWRLPFHDAYEDMIEPGIADLDNAPKGGMAGAITAALFLRRFAKGAPQYLHFDIYGWQVSDAPGRPKGGAGQGARSLFAALPKVLGL